MESWPTRKKRSLQGPASKQLRLTSGSNKPQDELLQVTARAVAQLLAQNRASTAWLQHVIILPIDNHIGKAMIVAGSEYNAERERGIPSSELGPPWVSVWKAMVLALSKANLESHELQTLQSHIDEMTEPSMVADQVRHCTAKAAHDGKSIILVTVVVPTLFPLMQMLLVVFRRMGGEVKHGAAPAMGTERTLRRLLKDSSAT